MVRSTLGLVVTSVISLALGFGASACAHGFDSGAVEMIDGKEQGAGGATTGSSSATTTTGVGGAAATSSTSASSGTAQSSVTSGGPSSASGGACDHSGSCDTCASCAISGVCSGEAFACTSDQACLALLSCVNGCTDQACTDACTNSHPDGTLLYGAVVTCLRCNACPVDCNGSVSGACAP